MDAESLEWPLSGSTSYQVSVGAIAWGTQHLQCSCDAYSHLMRASHRICATAEFLPFSAMLGHSQDSVTQGPRNRLLNVLTVECRLWSVPW